MVQRVFAFDPGTSALGWAVIDVDGDHVEIRACGVRLYALTRQRILDTMKQRLKPEDRMKARARRRMRLKKLREVLRSLGLLDAKECDHWKAGNGFELNRLLADGLETRMGNQSLVRLVFNVHRHRGSLTYGPERKSARSYLERLLCEQMKWHPVLADEMNRMRLVSAVFHRRDPKPGGRPPQQISRLAKLAGDELTGVWRALHAEFGTPYRTVIEASVPRLQKRTAHRADDEKALQLLEASGQRVTPRRLHQARLFIRQSLPDCLTAVCTLTGEAFPFQAALAGAVEIDHVLPKARGGSGGRSNLRLVLAQANRAKGAGSVAPAPAAMNPVGVVDADALRQSLHHVRSWFQSVPVPPAITFMPSRRVAALRMELLPSPISKDRTNLRHHALDAILTGLASSVILNGKVPVRLRAQIAEALAHGRLSARLERSASGRMHEDTRYGRASLESGFEPDSHITTRKAVESLTPAMLAKIAEPRLRKLASSTSALTEPLIAQAFGRTRRVKVVQKAQGHIRLAHKDGAFKAAVLTADNHHMDIVQLRDGRWKAFAVTRHDRLQPGWRPVWEVNRLGGKLVMRLHKGDMVEWQADERSREMLVVARLNGSSGIVHFSRPWAEAGSSSLVAAAAATLKMRQAKAVEADPAGRTRFRRSNAA
jgi:5-methylcytosine-specific restriction endonuclease McrA